MPSSNSSIDATPRRINPTKNYPSSQDKDAFAADQREQGLVSHITFPPSPTDSDSGVAMPDQNPLGSSSAIVKEERRITRDVDRGSPGDRAIFSDYKTPEQKHLAKRKSQYYEDAFAYREPHGSARERITKESMVFADVRTNVIVSEAFILHVLSGVDMS